MIGDVDRPVVLLVCLAGKYHIDSLKSIRIDCTVFVQGGKGAAVGSIPEQ